ncbi:MAG: hypothetical protein ABW166_05980 [Sedimenticola sp.]
MNGEANLAMSDKDYDWLGPGVYFWEADPVRAREWAEEKVTRSDYETPFVIGAVIDLGNCLDLMAREDLELVAAAYASLHSIHDTDGRLSKLPTNRMGNDRKLRFLDCAVIRHLHSIAQNSGVPEIEPIDAVRGLFTEGGELFPGSGFKRQTHIQLAVYNPANIKGFFRVPED